MNILQMYEQAKARNPGAIVLVHIGDFYEAFGDSAKIVQKVIGVTLTTRRFNGGQTVVKVAGVPYHSLEAAIDALQAAGHTVVVLQREAAGA